MSSCAKIRYFQRRDAVTALRIVASNADARHEGARRDLSVRRLRRVASHVQSPQRTSAELAAAVDSASHRVQRLTRTPPGGAAPNRHGAVPGATGRARVIRAAIARARVSESELGRDPCLPTSSQPFSTAERDLSCLPPGRLVPRRLRSASDVNRGSEVCGKGVACVRFPTV
jgi:hypothetical protein